MNGAMIRTLCVCAAILSLELCNGFTSGAVPEIARVKYSTGPTELSTLQEGSKYFVDKSYTLKNLPAELAGLTFTRRNWKTSAEITIDVAAGTEIYLLVGNGSLAKSSQDSVVAAGFVAAGEVGIANGSPNANLSIYKQQFTEKTHLMLKSGGWYGIDVAAQAIAVSGVDPAEEKKSDEPASPSMVHIDPIANAKAVAGPTTQISSPQTSINCLEILRTESGALLGRVSEVVLTVNRSDSSRLLSARFATPVGDDMGLARDEALRYIRVNYPNWHADSAEITFEDKYNSHNGGSIGTAIGTMVLSAIQGFHIDPDVAITGDISANGKVRAIGGVSAKLRGAIAGKCTLAAIPMENQGQLVDAITYGGAAVLSDIQVIGISTLEDAVATVRTDRDAKLKQAISLFAEIQQSIKKDSGYLKKKDAKAKLARVIELAPQHLSAQLLLNVVNDKQPKTMSATASIYYTSLAVRGMLAVLAERQQANTKEQVPSSVIRSGMTDLHKLLPIADPTVRPLINAWSGVIQSWTDLQQGSGSAKMVESHRQALLDEMAHVNTNPDLMQKMLGEGFSVSNVVAKS